MAHTELKLRERRTIEDMLNAKIPVRKIAAQIGRHVSTIYRDIKRNRYADEDLPELNGYYGVVAQRAQSKIGAPCRFAKRCDQTAQRRLVSRIDRGSIAL